MQLGISPFSLWVTFVHCSNASSLVLAPVGRRTIDNDMLELQPQMQLFYLVILVGIAAV